MSGVRFYADEHVSHAVIRGLRQRGVDIVGVVDTDMRGAKDEEHLVRARQEQRVIFTQDADFLRLHAAGTEHAGIAYVTQGASTGDIIRGLMLIYQVLAAEEMVGRIEYL